MAQTIAQMMETLEPDPWRGTNPFSPELQAMMDKTLDAKSDDEVESAFNGWIRQNQPCLFGRIAAKRSAITYCLIREPTLLGQEADLKNHIQAARLRWRAAGFDGKSSNFIIAVLSEKLARAVPSEAVKQIALRLCSLYLEREIESDRIYLDSIYLEKPGSTRATWQWLAGVNYFSAQGDGRWWQDHRFPAGLAFSANSVGHMVKSGKLTMALRDLEEVMGTELADYKEPNVQSLEKALELAMGTIGRASESVSGKATLLMPATEAGSDRPKCPSVLPESLRAFDHCTYAGFYHTDYTIPSEYFRPDVNRPADVRPFNLDFTYLFHKALDNPDYDLMGAGRRIRASGDASGRGPAGSYSYAAAKRFRGLESVVEIDDVPGLREALRLRKGKRS
jgi:hypothetical protein